MKRLNDHNFIAGIDQAHHRGHDGLGHATGDGNMLVRIEGQFIPASHLGRDGLAQRRRAPGNGVLVCAFVQGLVGGL